MRGAGAQAELACVGADGAATTATGVTGAVGQGGTSSPPAGVSADDGVCGGDEAWRLGGGVRVPCEGVRGPAFALLADGRRGGPCQ